MCSLFNEELEACAPNAAGAVVVLRNVAGPDAALHVDQHATLEVNTGYVLL